MEYILSSLDMFAGISDNLINYTFNVRYDFINDSLAKFTQHFVDVVI